MRKDLLGQLASERTKLVSSFNGKSQVLESKPQGLRIVSQPSDGRDVAEFKARLREKKAAQKRAKARQERKFKSTLACKFAELKK